MQDDFCGGANGVFAIIANHLTAVYKADEEEGVEDVETRWSRLVPQNGGPASLRFAGVARNRAAVAAASAVYLETVRAPVAVEVALVEDEDLDCVTKQLAGGY